MEMRVMVQLLAPRVEHGETANLGPEMLRIPGNVLESHGHGVKEQTIEQARVLECQWPQGVRQGKNHMAVGGLKELLLSSGEPCGLRRAMTFWAATVAAGVVGLDLVATLVACVIWPPRAAVRHTAIARRARGGAPERVDP